MKRAVFILVGALALAACGGGQNAANVAAPTAASRLAAFDTGKLLDGMTLPDATAYWSMAEARNGNTFPVKARIGQEDSVLARVMPGGTVAVYEDGKFIDVGIEGVRSRLQPIAQATWNADAQAGSCALILLAHADSPWQTLLELCLACVEIRVANLWLGTHDNRGNATRLLPLKVDTTQIPAEGYELTPDSRDGTVLLHWMKAVPVMRLGDGSIVKGSGPAGWGKAFATTIAERKPRPRRVQLALSASVSLRTLEKALSEISTAALAEIEPYWPVLKQPDASEPPREPRRLAAFEDTLELSARVQAPTLSEYWRAVEQSDRLPLPVRLDTSLPILYLCLDADSHWSSRGAPDAAWKDHADSTEVAELLVANAGEIDPDGAASALQLVLAIDRRAGWNQVIALLSAMKRTGVSRLYALAMDQIGPVPRLMDFSLRPETAGANEAILTVSREGIPEDGRYAAVLKLGADQLKADGPRYLATLARLAVLRSSTPDGLALQLPQDEPAGTFFYLINALVRLDMRRVRVIP